MYSCKLELRSHYRHSKSTTIPDIIINVYEIIFEDCKLKVSEIANTNGFSDERL